MTDKSPIKKKAKKGKTPLAREKAPSDAERSDADLIIVGIGASAGGLDALQRVLPGLPEKSGIAYVIVQHLAPKSRTLLPSLLTRCSQMPVETIHDGMTIRPGTIHITPPNKDVKIDGRRLKLSTAAPIGPKPSIDYFFSSLAEERKAHAVGIILSGSGADGAHGIRAIKSNDGITMAQTVDSAKFYSMPQAAIDTGQVDLVLPPEKIGPELAAALENPNLIARLPLDQHADEVGTILQRLQLHTGADFSDYKPATIHRRITRRMVVHKMHDLKDYVAHIEHHPDELVSLHKDMLISVTSFFRDADAFAALAHQLRELIKDKPSGDPLRVWVPGCATGEEAYSIAILLAEILGSDRKDNRIQIFATDIDEDSVQVARKAVYPVATVMDTDSERFERHFTHNDNFVQVKKHIRDMVVLARQDLIRDTPFLHLDLISCRNLMIYINTELQDKLLSLFHFSLNPDGILFLGKSESINQRSDLYETIDARWRIFRRKTSQTRRLLPKLLQRHYISPLHTQQGAISAKSPENGAFRESAFVSALLDVLDGCALLTDSQANIIYIRGDVSPYFRIPEGQVKENLNAVEMARPEIRFILQSLLHRCNKSECTVVSNGISFAENDNHGVRIRIGPVKDKAYADNRLIVLAPASVPERPPASVDTAETDERKQIRTLEGELATTRDHLQDTIEELETTTEELQSLNEELQSANEELQASNEELETSNEELQASNEELNTVNDELRAKSEEASELMDALTKSEKRYRDLVESANSAIVRWRSDGAVTFINSYAQSLFGYDEETILGRNVNVLLPRQETTGSDLTGLVADIVAHPEKFLSNVNENVCRDGRRVWMNWTNRAIADEKGNVREILAIGNDITALKETERALIESEAEQARQRHFLETLLDTTQACIAVMTGQELRYTIVNQAYQNLRPDMPMVGRTYREVFPDAVPAGAEAMVRNVINTGKPQEDFGYPVSIPGKPDATWDHQIVRMPAIEEGQEDSALVITWDSTEHSRAKAALERSEKSLKHMLTEKEILLKEIHHRVKNNMQVISSLVSLQTDVIEDEDTRAILHDISHRVRSMAMVHEKLYQSADLANLDFGDYVSTLLAYLWRAHSMDAAGVKLVSELDSVSLTVNTAVPCGLILNELVSNALKHAFKGRTQGRVTVSLGTDGADRTRIRLQVADDGNGLPPGLDWQRAGSLGLRLVRMLCEQIHAAVEVQGKPGVCVSISFPNPNPPADATTVH